MCLSDKSVEGDEEDVRLQEPQGAPEKKFPKVIALVPLLHKVIIESTFQKLPAGAPKVASVVTF